MSMNAGFLQVISLLVLVVLFGYVFKKYPLKVNIRYLVLASLFVLMSVVLNALSVMIPFFGVPSVKVSFALLPLMISGVVLSPSWAYLVGLVTDLIGLLITPTAFPFLGFTLNHVLVAVLPAIWYQKSRTLDAKKIQKMIVIVLFALAIIASIYIFSLDIVSIDKSNFEVTLPMKLGISIFMFVMSAVLSVILYYLRKRMSEEEASELARWMLVVVMIEVLINMILTPFWLDSMYGIPWFISTFIRVVKSCVMIPFNVVIGYSIVKIVKRMVLK